MEFTKEEISLCKQIREKDLLLKPVKEGDWIRNEYGKPSTDLACNLYIGNTLRFVDIKHWFPLWTISDCLEFLEEKGINHIFNFMRFKNGDWRFTAEDNKYKKLWGEGKTRLEACLETILAVFEDK